MSMPPPSADGPVIAGQWRLGFILAITLSAAMGGLLFGWDWVVIGGAKPFFESYFGISDPAVSGWANSCALIGCFFGAVLGGASADRFGRKGPLIASALLFGATSIGIALAHNFDAFVAWRIAGGVAIGLASSLSPLYIAEIAPARIRGALVAVNQLTIVIGVLGAQLTNWWIVRDLPAGMAPAQLAVSWYGTEAWRWMFAICAIPSVVFLLGMLFAPESPRWLLTRGRRDDARRVLSRIGGDSHADAALSQVEATLDQPGKKASLRELLSPKVRGVLVIGIVLAVFQQWCGINVIFNYAEEIFQAAGYDLSSVIANIAWTGSVNLAFTVVALNLVDRAGRRPLMLFGAAGLAVIYTALAVCFALGIGGLPTLLLVLAAIACYAMSLAPVTWVVIAEIFPNRIRGAAIAVAVGALWLASFVLTYSFPLLNSTLKAHGTFGLYAAICALGFLFIWFKMPETKGRSLEEIEND